MAYVRLGDLLIAAGVIGQEELQKALSIQKQTRERLGDVLIENGMITEQHLIEALQMQLGVDFVDLTAVSIPLELAKFVPRSIAKKYCVVPVKLVKDELYVAMSDPLNFVAQEEIKAASHKQVVPMIATRRATESAISTLYGNEGAARAIEEMKREAGDSQTDIIPAQMAQTADNAANEAPTIRFVNSVIERAIAERASDIHLEPQEGEMVVRMRIDGALRRVFTVPSNLQATVISRLKIMGGMNISERKIPQDGRAMYSAKGKDIDLRINSMPTVHGEKMVLRLLDKSAGSVSRQSIGLEGEDLEKYEALLKNTSGVILIVGPTGSGKSTTMCAMLRQLCSEETNIMTLEDPVEYDIPGVNQCQIEREDRHDLCRRTSGHPPPGPGYHLRRRDPGRRDGPDRRPGGHYRPPGAVHPPHQRCRFRHRPPGGHRCGALSDFQRPPGCHLPAAGPQEYPTARKPISPMPRSWRCWVCRRIPTRCSTEARAARSASTPAPGAAGLCLSSPDPQFPSAPDGVQ